MADDKKVIYTDRFSAERDAWLREQAKMTASLQAAWGHLAPIPTTTASENLAMPSSADPMGEADTQPLSRRDRIVAALEESIEKLRETNPKLAGKQSRLLKILSTDPTWPS